MDNYDTGIYTDNPDDTAHALQKVILFGDAKHVEVRTSNLEGSRL